MAFRRLHQLQLVFKRCSWQPLSTYQSQSEVIQVTPKVSRFDQKVHIKVEGLPKQTKVTLHASTEHVWQRKPAQFVSCGHYISSPAGEIDLQRDASVGGTYTGPANIRMAIRNVELPVTYQVSVYLGHLELNDLHVGNSQHDPFSTLSVERVVMPANVKKIPVREGRVRGMLFLPSGEGPFPGVIDMYGLGGGLFETRAALLAANGFASFALAYFRYDDLPDSLDDQKFDYFENAVEWFSSLSSVLPGGIGIAGMSGGASLALMMAWKCPQVKAYVRINSPGFHALMDMYHEGQLLRAPGLALNFSLCPVTDEGRAFRNGWILSDESIIPLWEKDVHLLTLVCDDDGQVSPWFGSMHYDLYPEDRRHLVEVVHYPGAGHLMEPPYTAHCRFCYNPFFGEDLLWGGQVKEHAVAQEDAWQRIVEFFNKHLRS